MTAVSERYLSAISTAHRRMVEVTVSTPDDPTPRPLRLSGTGSTVTMSGTLGARYSASLTVAPGPAPDLLHTPGALVSIRSGVDYGAGMREWVPVGVLTPTAAAAPITSGEVDVILVDGAGRLSECRFVQPWATQAGSRSAAIAALVADASPEVEIVQESTGGTTASALFDRDRLEAINTLAGGGSLDAAFAADGRFVIRDDPILDPASAVWLLRTGAGANILPGGRLEQPLDRLYNAVVATPAATDQGWTDPAVVRLADIDHPRHRSRIGDRPYIHTDATSPSHGAAVSAARALLTRLLTVTDQIRIPSLGNPSLAYGDTINVVHSGERSFSGSYLVEGWVYNLATGAQDITARSTSLPSIEDA